VGSFFHVIDRRKWKSIIVQRGARGKLGSIEIEGGRRAGMTGTLTQAKGVEL